MSSPIESLSLYPCTTNPHNPRRRPVASMVIAATTVAATLSVTVAAGPAAVAAPAAPAASSASSVTDRVIVRLAADVPLTRGAAFVQGHHGQVQRWLPIVHSLAATLPHGELPALRAIPGIRAVTPDETMHALGTASGTTPAPVDTGSLDAITSIIGAKASWSSGYAGQGVDVALVDTGVTPVPGLGGGNVINGPDLSFDSQAPALTRLDGFGHGTHLAGIIAGHDLAGTTAGSSFTGVAPASRVISLKVGAYDGSADISQVIAAIDWTTQHAHDPGLNIRVLNLSFGTDSVQSYAVDPLAYAVENAWRKGIVVVVAAGNDGTSRTTLNDPASDPFVLAVGAEDPGTTLATTDDTVPSFASRGTSTRHPDIVAPGVHVASLRDPGSVVDTEYPDARLGTRFFRGSGTSQSAAVVSGGVALLLSKYPGMTPDQVKQLLMRTARPLADSTLVRGSGLIDVAAAEKLGPSPATQTGTRASGTGSLEQARGSAHLTDGTTPLTGEQDIFGTAWKGSAWATADSNGKAWSAGTWNGTTWTGSGWTLTRLLGTIGMLPAWSGTAWTAPSWSGGTWLGHSWTDMVWDGHSWTGGSWEGHSWTDATWDGHSWTDSSWSYAGWN